MILVEGWEGDYVEWYYKQRVRMEALCLRKNDIRHTVALKDRSLKNHAKLVSRKEDILERFIAKLRSLGS